MGGGDAEGEPTTPQVYRRTGVLDTVEEWLADEDGAPVLLITGPPGTGKSEVAAQIATRFAQTKTGKHRIGTLSFRPGSRGGPTNVQMLLAQLEGFAEALAPARVHASRAHLGGTSMEVNASFSNDGTVGE